MSNNYNSSVGPDYDADTPSGGGGCLVAFLFIIAGIAAGGYCAAKVVFQALS